MDAARRAVSGAAVVGLVMMAAPARAAQSEVPTGAPCSEWSDNSCWLLQNQTTERAAVVCEGALYGTWIQEALAPGEAKVEQLDRGWGDGLGFPEPNIDVTCAIQVSGKQA